LPDPDRAGAVPHRPGFLFQEHIMTKPTLGMTFAAVLLSATAAAAQTNRSRTPDKPLPNSDAAKAPQTTTISGCVVRDAANGGQPTISANGISYRLTGRADRELERYLGKRVEVTGALESGSTGVRATSGKTGEAAKGETGAPKDQTATAGQSDVPATGAPRDNTAPGVQDARAVPDSVPLATEKGTTADLTSRVEVKTIRIVSPNCL
jgi:hypothetical protein